MAVASTDVARLLGLPDAPDTTGLDLADALERGLTTETVERVVRLVAPDDPRFRYLLVKRATLGRRRREERLSSEESERVERVARLWAQAKRVWRDDDAARRFLAEPHPLLRGRRPLDLARTAVGARAVEDVLGRLEHGTAA